MKLDEIYMEYNREFENNAMPYTKCENCGNVYYYPRNLCPVCGSSNIEVKKSSGKGEIYSYTEFNGGFFGIISFKEGFRAYMDIQGENPDIGKEIKVKFKYINENILPYAQIKK
jgi:uncharacterized OB-fold protein